MEPTFENVQPGLFEDQVPAVALQPSQRDQLATAVTALLREIADAMVATKSETAREAANE